MIAFYVAMLDTDEQKDKFNEIYTRYYGMMYQVAKSITHDSSLAEDALHETCLKLIEDIDLIRTENQKELAYYLRIVTHNRTVDFMRKWQRRNADSLDSLNIDKFSWNLPDTAPETLIITKEKLDNAIQCVNEMPAIYRTALIMQVQGYTIQEIAKMTGCKESTVKTRIHRARKIILHSISQENN